MKNFALIGVLFLTLFVVSSFNSADSFKGANKILGEWEYSAPDAPYDYQNGVMVFSKDGKELKGEMIVGGQSMAMDDIVYKKNNVKATVNVQGELVSFDLNFTKKAFEGTVDYSQGTLEINGTKK